MKTILIMGGYGATGKPLTKHLLAQTDHKIVIAGRNLDKAKAFVDSLNNPRVTAKRVDGADLASLKQALRGVDFLLVAAPTTDHAETVVRARSRRGWIISTYNFQILNWGYYAPMKKRSTKRNCVS
jgi:saccharopine dehydrogenase (NAD+, L-lysine-forming)